MTTLPHLSRHHYPSPMSLSLLLSSPPDLPRLLLHLTCQDFFSLFLSSPLTPTPRYFVWIIRYPPFNIFREVIWQFLYNMRSKVTYILQHACRRVANSLRLWDILLASSNRYIGKTLQLLEIFKFFLLLLENSHKCPLFILLSWESTLQFLHSLLYDLQAFFHFLY